MTRQKAKMSRQIISALLYHSGMLWLLRKIINKKLPLIINYHEIYANVYDTYWCNTPNLLTSETLFASHLHYLRQHYRIVDLEELCASSASGLMAITFDDGYKGVFSSAFPLLRKWGIPATIFLTTDFIGSSSLPWWENIAAQIRSILSLPIDSRREYLREVPENWRSCLDSPDSIATSLQHYKWANNKERGRLDSFLRSIPSNAPSNRERIFLSMDEIREMRSAGLSFGCHTKAHPVLLWLDDSSLKAELTESKRIITDITGSPSCWFSYPCGIFSEREERAVQEVGFAGAVQTSMYPDRTGRYAMQRIDLVASNSTGFYGGFSKASTEVALSHLNRKMLMRLFRG